MQQNFLSKKKKKVEEQLNMEIQFILAHKFFNNYLLA